MTSQGICPQPKCMWPEAIGMAPILDRSEPSNAGLIGGLVGGLIGGGVLIGAIVFFIIHHQKKKHTIPLALKKRIANNLSRGQMTARQEEAMVQSSRNSNVLSGVIPISFLPSRIQSSLSNPSSNHTLSTTSSQWQTPNPFDDPRPSSLADSRRTSIESHIEPTHTALQAIRAIPQIMRVKHPQEEILTHPTPSNTQDLLDDTNKTSAQRDTKPTDSLVSSADGEITIFWHGAST
ncbi:hypothetical protein BY458DRAFT_440722 [Sporodiniella umbellata]|nr:hypothetical protein BY458DRAFT_440722 [Sporodiniella umbellata]